MNHEKSYNRACKLVERYFDGTTTLAEERELRLLLADSSLKGRQLAEERAVLGFLAAGTPRRKPRQSAMRRFAPTISVAASFALVLTFVLHLVAGPGRQQQSVALAYVAGQQIEDSQLIMQLVDNQLDAFGQASAEIDDELDFLGSFDE